MKMNMDDTEHLVKSADYLRGIQARMGGEPRLLIVEDCQSDALMLLRELEPFMVQTEVTYSALQALRKLSQSKYDLAFVDIKMPIFGGLELVSEIAGHQQSTDYIMVTGYPDAAVKSNAVRAGVLLWLPKPISHDTLSLLFKAK